MPVIASTSAAIESTPTIRSTSLRRKSPRRLLCGIGLISPLSSPRAPSGRDSNEQAPGRRARAAAESVRARKARHAEFRPPPRSCSQVSRRWSCARIEILRKSNDVADDEEHRHGLPERPAESDEDSAEQSADAVTHDDVFRGLPARAADAERRLAQHSGGHAENIAHNRRNVRQNHQRQNQTRRQKTEAVAVFPEKGDLPEFKSVRQERLHVILHDRHEDKESPHAVDHTRNRREQIERLAQNLPDAGRRVDKPERRHKSRRNREQKCERRRQQRSDDRRKRAVNIPDRIPFGPDQKARPNSRQAGADPISELDEQPPQAAEARAARSRRRQCGTADPCRRG